MIPFLKTAVTLDQAVHEYEQDHGWEGYPNEFCFFKSVRRVRARALSLFVGSFQTYFV